MASASTPNHEGRPRSGSFLNKGKASHGGNGSLESEAAAAAVAAVAVAAAFAAAAAVAPALAQDAGAIKSEEQAVFSNQLFDGRGLDVPWILTRERPTGSAQAAGAGPAATTGTPEQPEPSLDRLSASDLSGYSPQVLMLQSRLNAVRPPGVPPIELTGRLDYQTLAFPGAILGDDLQILSDRLKRIEALAKNEAVPDSPGDGQGPSWDAALRKAREALQAFNRLALQARAPGRIDRRLLLDLSRRQKEAERWSSIAWIEGDKLRLRVESRFMTPDLLATLESLPEPEAAKQGYLRAGKARQRLIKSIESDDARELGELTSASWRSRFQEARRTLGSCQRRELVLDRSLRLYAAIPYALAEIENARTAPRRWLDGIALRWFPHSRRAEDAGTRRQRRRELEAAFLLIAREASTAFARGS